MRKAAALAVLLACAPSRNVVVGGRSMPYEQAASDEFHHAKATLDQGQFELAAQQFAAFIDQYPDSELVDEAQFRRGQALDKAGKLAEAQTVLQEFLEKRPTSAFKNPAAVELGIVQQRLGQAAPPPPVPADVGQLSEKQKNQAASALAESFAKSGQPGEAVRWAARAVENATGADQEARMREYETALEAAPADDRSGEHT